MQVSTVERVCEGLGVRMWELLLRRQRSVLDDLGGDTEVADDVASPGGLLSICRDYLGGVDPPRQDTTNGKIFRVALRRCPCVRSK